MRELKITSWNIGKLPGKSKELVATMIQKRTKGVYLQKKIKNQWVGEKIRKVEGLVTNFNIQVKIKKVG